jgi:glycosyltransferase involved in cell wall biosynthesis
MGANGGLVLFAGSKKGEAKRSPMNPTKVQKMITTLAKEAPLVSVVIVAYNSGRYIARAIESVVAQTLTSFEIVIQDDCSDDDTAAVVNSFKDSRIRLFRNSKNLGIVSNSNLGIANSRGKFLVRLDADDFLLNHHLELCVRALMLNPNVALAYGPALVMQGTQMRPGSLESAAPPVEAGKSFFLRALQGNPCISCATMFRRDAFYRAGQFRDSYLASPIYNDYSLWLRLATVGDVAAVREPIGVSVKRKNSVSDCSRMSSPKRQNFRYLEDTIEKIVDLAAEEGFLKSDELRDLQLLLARRWLHAADRCSLLPEHCLYCLKKTWEIQPLAFLQVSYLLRICMKRMLRQR